MKACSCKKAAPILALILLLGSLCALFASCGSTGDEVITTAAPAVGSDEATAEITRPTTDENGYLLDNLPELNYDGRTVHELYWSDREHEEFFVEQETGEMVNDALFKRNAAVEDRLGITFDFIGTLGNSSHVADFTTKVKTVYDAGDHDIDIIGGYSISTASCAAAGLLMELSDLPYLDFSMPWWPDTLIDQATINNKLYFASGDISANLLYMMYVCYFNQDMLTDFGRETPYALVDSREWTIDKMIEYSAGVYEDVNVDGKKDEGDRFGFYGQKLHSDAFLWGTGIKTVDNSGEELTVSEEWAGERLQNMLEKICTFMYNTDDAIMITSDATMKYFRDGLSMFWFDRARQGANFESEMFGILPIPMYDTNQENYACVMGNPFTIYGMIADEQDPEAMAAVLECMASESYRKVTPALFEITMKTRYSNDGDMARMYDIVRSTVVFDMGRIFYSNIGGIPASTWENAVVSNAPAWSRTAAAQAKLFQKKLDELMKSFE